MMMMAKDVWFSFFIFTMSFFSYFLHWILFQRKAIANNRERKEKKKAKKFLARRFWHPLTHCNGLHSQTRSCLLTRSTNNFPYNFCSSSFLRKWRNSIVVVVDDVNVVCCCHKSVWRRNRKRVRELLVLRLIKCDHN